MTELTARWVDDFCVKQDEGSDETEALCIADFWVEIGIGDKYVEQGIVASKLRRFVKFIWSLLLLVFTNKSARYILDNDVEHVGRRLSVFEEFIVALFGHELWEHLAY